MPDKHSFQTALAQKDDMGYTGVGSLIRFKIDNYQSVSAL